MKVTDILCVEGNTLYTVPPERALAEATRTMAELGIGSLPVMGHCDLVGAAAARWGTLLASCAALLGAPPAWAQSPAGTEWHTCLGTAQCREMKIGSGAEAQTGAMVRVRTMNWWYAADAPDFKGARTSTAAPADQGYELLPTPPSAYGYTMTDLIVGMKVGGVRAVVLPMRRVVIELELFDVAPTVAALRQRGFLGVNPPTTLSARAGPPTLSPEAERQRVAALAAQYQQAEEEKARARREREQAQKAEDDERLAREAAARAVLSDAYPALVARARARSKADPVALGIVLGERWHGVQDANNCRVQGWAGNTNIPFCLYPDADFKIPANERWQTCVRIDDSKFETAWIASPQGNADLGEGLGAALVAMAAAGERARQCFVNVSMLASGVVGKVSMPTSLRANHVEALVAQLRAKYGSRYTTRQQSWTDGHKTAVLEWTLPDLHVRFTEQAETKGGHAFDGGWLEIFTSEWARTIDDEARKNRKPTL
jgi:hypothetical protein